MERPFLPVAALAGVALVLGATTVGAAERHARGSELRRGAQLCQPYAAPRRVAGVRWRHHAGRAAYGMPGYDDAFYAPLSVGFGRRSGPSYASTGNGFGSTGYGYGGDFSAAYTTGYDDFQRIGYGDGEGTYGGQPYGDGARVAVRGGYGYGQAGWSPPIQPAGGLAVYSPGAYGPGPRILTIPTRYTPGTSPFGPSNAD